MAASLPMEQDPIQVLDHHPPWQDTSDDQTYPISQLIGQRRSAVIHEDFIPVCEDLLDFCQLCYENLADDDCQANSSYYQPRVNKIIQLLEELYRVMLNLCQVERDILQIQNKNSPVVVTVESVSLLEDQDTNGTSNPWGKNSYTFFFYFRFILANIRK